MSACAGLIQFFARKLEPDWNIFAVLDGSLQTSNQIPCQVLLSLNVQPILLVGASRCRLVTTTDLAMIMNKEQNRCIECATLMLLLPWGRGRGVTDALWGPGRTLACRSLSFFYQQDVNV